MTADSSLLTPPRQGQRPPEQAELFYEPLLTSYLDPPDTVPRDWLQDKIREYLGRDDDRFVLLVGEPGAGKTGLMAALARANPGALRYFVRLDSTTPLSGADAVSMMLRVGHQLAHLHPEIFDPELLKIEVMQRVEHAPAGSSITGVKIDDFNVSPFYRTAIRVQQNVATLAGGLTGIEISRATVEPRLLDVATLSHLALLDPALVLARKSPGEKIIVLVDALDEVMGQHGVTTVLDWLETFEEPPSNLRFVLSSRSHPRLRTLEGVRGASLKIIRIEEFSEQVARDVRRYASNLFDDTKALEKAPGVDSETAVTSLVRAALGNFAYLTAYGRTLRAALAAGSAEQLSELLEFDTLPAGLPQLYAAFARRMRRQIESLGLQEIASPRGPGDELVAPWEGVGQRILGVLSVALAPLTLKQLIALGGIRVWESAAANVLQTLAPFLDETHGTWKLFHPSLGEFLQSADQEGAADVAINAREWHTRIVRFYRGTGGWADVNWGLLDSYGLLHAAAHLAASSEDPLAVCELVTSSLRTASKERFLTDLPFRRIAQTALDAVRAGKSVESILSDGVFLQLVQAGLSQGAQLLDPAVYGLMARLGRVDEALARAAVMEPGLRKYRTLEAIRECTPAGSRAALGPLDGVELLVGAAVEVPVTSTPIVGGLGYDRGTCLHDAAKSMVSYDLNRALNLAAMADQYDRAEKAEDTVLGAAASSAAPKEALELLTRMGSKRLSPSVEAAEKATAGAARNELIAFAMAHLDDEEPSHRIPLIARLIVALSGEDSTDARRTAAALRKALGKAVQKESSAGSPGGVVRAAEILHPVDRELAVRLLETCDRKEVDSLLADTLLHAARIWVSWGKPEDARIRINRALEAYRALGWYGPADNIAEASAIVAVFDAEWSRQLLQEAIALIEPEVRKADSSDMSRLDSTLSQVVSNLRKGNRERALEVARWIRGGWIYGGGWDWTDGHGNALAMIALDAVEDNPSLASQLLLECLTWGEREVRQGRSDPRVVYRGLFTPDEESEPKPASNVGVVEAMTYLANEVNYWGRGREWRFLLSPASVLRSLDDPFPATASWARAMGTAAAALAASDIAHAIPMAYWPADPGERLIGLAGVAAALDATDPRRNTTMAAIEATLADLPRYRAKLDLTKVPQGPILMYLDPTVRARFEAALLLSPDLDPNRILPPEDEQFWYINKVYHAETLFNDLLAGRYSEMAPEEFARQMESVSEDYARFDDLLKDLLEVAASYSVAFKDTQGADARMERIAHPHLKAAAKLLLLQFAPTDGKQRMQEALTILESLSDEVSPLQCAELASIAATVCESAGGDGGIIDWALKRLEASDPLMKAHGAIALSQVVPEPRIQGLLSEALDASEQIPNQYLRGDALENLLGPAIAARDTERIHGVLGRLLDEDWMMFAEGLRRAMPAIVSLGGFNVIERMDASMRRAQSVIGTKTSPARAEEHFDGVLPPALREQAFKAAADAERFLQSYVATYLDQADVGPAHKWVQDSRLGPPDPDDRDFGRLGGRHSGLSVWLAAHDQPIWRIVDIRFVFDNAAAAAEYHRLRLKANSEGKPEVSKARAVGEDCHVFGGTDSKNLGGTTIKMTAYYYIFRVGRVVVKLFAAQGQESQRSLKPDSLLPMAERILERIRSAGFA